MSTFIHPCSGARLTSPYKPSHRPDHNGVDFAKAGTVEIKAVAAGRVMRSYRSSSYGEVIFVLHNIGGQEYETVYAHLREGSRKFKEGDNVKQGAVLGLMGNTGRSTGQHLHFELHKGRWTINKVNAVDPMKYISSTSAGAQPSGAVAKPYPGYALKEGLTDDPNVESVQRKFGLRPDGDFGPITKKATVDFQKRHGLVADGIVGPKTWAKIF